MRTRPLPEIYTDLIDQVVLLVQPLIELVQIQQPPGINLSAQTSAMKTVYKAHLE